MISTTFLVNLALCLSSFSSGGKRNVLPIQSAGSKVGIGLDPNGFSSSLNLMKTVGVFSFSDEPSESPIGDPEEIFSSDDRILTYGTLLDVLWYMYHAWITYGMVRRIA